MTLYQRKTLPSTNIGSPSHLPAEIAGLDNASLADLSASLGQAAAELGYAGQGFFPVQDNTPVAGPRTISQLEFMQRIPAQKRVAIVAAADDPASPDFTLRTALQMIQAANNGVNLDDPDTVNLLAYAESKNLLSADDVTAIRA